MPTKNIDLFTLMDRFHSEERCRDFLEELRWPNGIACPRCGDTTISRIKKRAQFDCDGCRYQFSVTAGTVLQDSKLPLTKWFVATFLIVEAKKGISGKQLQRTLGTTYRTAWHLSHRIRGAMGQAAQSQLLGIIEADETFVGGKPRYPRAEVDEQGRHKHGPRADNPKTIVLGALERGGDVRLRVAPDRRRTTLHAFIKSEVSDEAEAVYTDDWMPYRGIADENTRHETVNHNEQEWVRGDVTTNGIEGVWSLLKRSIVGSYHQLSVKHLPAYLDELEWRFNNRDNPHLFRDTLRVLVTADPLTYESLTS